MTSHLARDCLVATLAFQAIASITSLSLNITSFKFINVYSDTLFDLNPNDKKTSELVPALPPSFSTSAINLAVASSIALLVTAFTVSTFTFCAWSDRKRKCLVAPQRVILIIILNAVFSLIALITILAIHTRSATFDPNANDFGHTRAYDSGTFDLESWACSMANSRTVEAIYPPQCHIEHIAKCMLIAEFLLSMIAVGIAAWDSKGADKRWKGAIEMKKARNAYFHEDDEGDGNGLN